MPARMDHVVLWVDDPLRSVEFYEKVVGLPGVRTEAFRAGNAPFPSVRVAEDAIIDLMARAAAPIIDAMIGVAGTAGHSVNHVCLAMTRAEVEALRQRLAENGVSVSKTMVNSFGARGLAAEAFYFLDPDNNVIEARYYE
jgi:catechol 2,3-dioxygenase-like lactoylglutathione lyase family enzyme